MPRLVEKTRILWTKHRPLQKMMVVLVVVWSLLMTILLPPFRFLVRKGRYDCHVIIVIIVM